MDTDGDGTLDNDELRVALRALGHSEASIDVLVAGCS